MSASFSRWEPDVRLAKLSWNTPGAFEHNGIYDNKDPKVTEDSWAKLNYDLGSIALSDEYADSVGLPRAQRFPWDQSKGLYFLNGYHGIHCLVCAVTSHFDPLVLKSRHRKSCVSR